MENIPSCKGKNFTLYNGDSLVVLQSLESGSVDGVIADPPYSSGGLHSSARTQSTGNKYTLVKGKGKFPDFLGDNRDQFSYGFWASMWLTECFRVMKDNTPICLFTDWRQLPLLSTVLQSAGFVWRGIFVWDKTRAARPTKGRYSQQAEFVVWGSKGHLPTERGVGYLHGLHTCSVNKGGRFHQTSKPIELMKSVVEIVPEGGRVLDPFMGSGSTGVASLDIGRGFVGVEMTEHYFDVACARLEKAIHEAPNGT